MAAVEGRSLNSEGLRCRFYEQQYPEVGDCVVVTVNKIAEMGAYVTLLEYDGIEGMILLSELSRRRIRSINKLIRVNRNEVVMVLRVDKEKGYIDLSKRRVSPDDILACEERYNKAKAVHGILRQVADRRNTTVLDLYEQVGWPLYRKYGHCYDAFKLALSPDANEDIFAELPEVEDETKNEILNYIRRKLAPQPVKIRADIEVTCFNYNGITAIKSALTAGEAVGSAADEVKVRLIAPPLYVMTTMTLDREHGIQRLQAAIEAISKSITDAGGQIDVKMAPKAVTLRDESELQAMMDRLAMENEEVDGDAPEDV